MSTFTFPVATHTYFRITNRRTERLRFLEDPHYEPVFTYGIHMNQERVAHRLEKAASIPAARQSLGLVQASLQLQQEPSEENLARFRQLNQDLFGAPRRDYVDKLLMRVKECVTDDMRPYWQYIQTTLPSDLMGAIDIIPPQVVFDRYRAFFHTYAGDIDSEQASLPHLLDLNLERTGLRRQGWRVVVRENDSPTKTRHRNKTILVGVHCMPRTHSAAVRIAVHEVYGHALRGHQDSITESEGFASLLEQLVGDKFVFRRSYRYLAAALGWGVFGTPMTFRQVYEIIWRTMVITGTYSPQEAQMYAFDECTRVFRGGVPSLPGAIYLKDSTYFDANIRMWQNLKEHPLQYNEFVDVIEGRRRILS